MSSFQVARFFSRRVQVEPAKPPVEPKDDGVSDKSDGVKEESSNGNATVDQEQLKADNPPQEDPPDDKEQLKAEDSPPEEPPEDQERLKADNSPQEDPPEQVEDIGDYIGLKTRPYIRKILEKLGDRNVLFADKVFKLTCSGKMKKRLFLVTDFNLYILDPETDSLRRRIALAVVDRLCVSKLQDNFFAIIIPTEYDLLMASTRKTEIVALLVDATRSASNYDLEVSQSNSFEYNAAAEVVKEVHCEEVEGGVRTKIVKK